MRASLKQSPVPHNMEKQVAMLSSPILMGFEFLVLLSHCKAMQAAATSAELISKISSTEYKPGTYGYEVCVRAFTSRSPAQRKYRGMMIISTMSFNPVGGLQEFCTSHHLNLPYYQTAESGALHARTFTVTCKVGKYVKTVGLKHLFVGSSSTKKEAKKKAAASLLALLMTRVTGSSKEKLKSKHLNETHEDARKDLGKKEREVIGKISTQVASPAELKPRYVPDTENKNRVVRSNQ
uniref:DRBM domain-containing protein n=1 Tax=Timema douglasi TaxID=61478 RepID=A0A7R8ZC72_TIMDO|nr:unnamed protein product [Timema douglasi]